MNGQDPRDHDHWDTFADSADLTIEGQRLIAQEIVYEVRVLWRLATSWLRQVTGTAVRRRSTPPI
jgi:hypothetical protein